MLSSIALPAPARNSFPSTFNSALSRATLAKSSNGRRIAFVSSSRPLSLRIDASVWRANATIFFASGSAFFADSASENVSASWAFNAGPTSKVSKPRSARAIATNGWAVSGRSRNCSNVSRTGASAKAATAVCFSAAASPAASGPALTLGAVPSRTLRNSTTSSRRVRSCKRGVNIKVRSSAKITARRSTNTTFFPAMRATSSPSFSSSSAAVFAFSAFTTFARSKALRAVTNLYGASKWLRDESLGQ